MSENMRKIDKNKQKTRQKGKYLTTKIANEEFLCQTQTKIRLIEVPIINRACDLEMLVIHL